MGDLDVRLAMSFSLAFPGEQDLFLVPLPSWLLAVSRHYNLSRAVQSGNHV